jgi:hypothetical protein
MKDLSRSEDSAPNQPLYSIHGTAPAIRSDGWGSNPSNLRQKFVQFHTDFTQNGIQSYENLHL